MGAATSSAAAGDAVLNTPLLLPRVLRCVAASDLDALLSRRAAAAAAARRRVAHTVLSYDPLLVELSLTAP
jgi:hypothetical protein